MRGDGHEGAAELGDPDRGLDGPRRRLGVRAPHQDHVHALLVRHEVARRRELVARRAGPIDIERALLVRQQHLAVAIEREGGLDDHRAARLGRRPGDDADGEGAGACEIHG